MNKEILEILIAHIQKILDKDGNDIPFNKIELKYVKLKYGYKESLNVFIDDVPLTVKQKTSYKIQWLCRCGRINTCLLCKYFGKRKLVCQHCAQKKKYEDHYLNNPFGIKGKPIKTQKPIKKEHLFENESEEYKQAYFQKHLTPDIFYKFLPYMYSISNIVLDDNIRNKIEYLPYYSIYCNGFKYVPKIKIDNNLYTVYDIQFKCKTCGAIFNKHANNLRKLDVNNIVCKYCNFQNHLYTIKKYKDTNILYQSNLEKDFLNFCFNNNINVINGPEIPYIFNNKSKIYVSDFYLPDYKYIVEIKATHRFYYNDIKSGKQQAKNFAAEEYAKQNNLKFKFVLDDISKFCNSLLMKEIV